MNWRMVTRGVQLVVRRDDGQDLIEYGMLASLIAIVVLVAVRSFATFLKTGLWDVVANLL